MSWSLPVMARCQLKTLNQVCPSERLRSPAEWLVSIDRGRRPPNESRFVVPDQDVPATRQRRIVNPNVYR